MTTQRTIDLGLHLLSSRGYGAFLVRPAHHRLCNYNTSYQGPVRDWLRLMPDERRSTLIETLADGCDDRAVYDAERLIRLLGALLPGARKQVARIAAQPWWSTGYADGLMGITLYNANDALKTLRQRDGGLLAAIALAESGALAAALLNSHAIPDRHHNAVTEPAARAVHMVVTRLVAADYANAVIDLTTAIREAGW